jgi:hypothetical protein
LGDGLAGVVQESTADILNRLVKKFGAFDTGTDFLIRDTVKDTPKRPQADLVVIALIGIFAVGRNLGAPRPTQMECSRSRINTSPFAKRRGWSRPFD